MGFAVTGLADPAKLLRKSGLRPGDALVLTKPLGTGIVLAGAHARPGARGVAAGGDRVACGTSNAAASQILRDVSARRRAPMSPASAWPGICWRCCARPVSRAVLWPDQVPALPGALELAAHGVESTLAPENRRLLPTPARMPRTALLLDPQTSGGLLAGIAPDRAEACVAALREAGIAAAIIGAVEYGEPAIRLG